MNRDIRNQLEFYKKEYGFIEPDRGNLNDESIKWRTSKPNYDIANLSYFKGKTKNHKADSLEKLVEDLVKTWEMEASHKIDFKQWQTVDHASYSVTANGGNVFKGEDAVRVGNYNALFDTCPKHLYDNKKEDFETSHHLFRGAFTSGFSWELLCVFSGPPKVTFTWRHWGEFLGEYKNNKGNGEVIEMYGFCCVTVNDKLKVQNIEVYYKPEEFLEVLEGKRPLDDLKSGKSVLGSGCPVAKSASSLVFDQS
jgi:hypothetical protein